MSVIGKRAAISDVQIVRAQNACNYGKDNAHKKGQVGCGPKTALSVPATALQSRKPASVVYHMEQNRKQNRYTYNLMLGAWEQFKGKEENKHSKHNRVENHSSVHRNLLLA